MASLLSEPPMLEYLKYSLCKEKKSLRTHSHGPATLQSTCFRQYRNTTCKTSQQSYIHKTMMYPFVLHEPAQLIQRDAISVETLSKLETRHL
jgi:hypothetical protein